ncbi:MAG: 30S ribosomal protein S7 [Candidatus Doudnabacteria bacterium]|nr:30S ribosomal protein S7 [Candidatus Doudnabacteria bacterium]
MPRKSRSYDKHTPEPDPKFGSVKYSKFINYMMERGKKNVARKIFYSALEIVGEKAASLTPAAPAPVKVSPAKTSEDKSGAKEDLKQPKVTKLDGRQVFDIALKNIAPIMELKSRRIGGANYQVPMEVSEPRRTSIGMKWLIAAARARKGAPMAQKLAAEIVDGFNKVGSAIKKREDTHRMAEANKAFAHFARFGRR